MPEYLGQALDIVREETAPRVEITHGDVATRLAAVQQARGVASYGKSAVTQASTYGKKAVSITTSLVKPKLGSLASFATDHVSKGVSKLGLGNSKAEASGQEEAYPAVAGGAGGAAGESGPILPLYPPGSITLMVRTNDEGDHEALEVDATWSGLCRFELSETMVSDHYLTSYFSSLARCIKSCPVVFRRCASWFTFWNFLHL